MGGDRGKFTIQSYIIDVMATEQGSYKTNGLKTLMAMVLTFVDINAVWILVFMLFLIYLNLFSLNKTLALCLIPSLFTAARVMLMLDIYNIFSDAQNCAILDAVLRKIKQSDREDQRCISAMEGEVIALGGATCCH